MTTLLNTQTPVDQLDRELRELTREHAHVVDLDAFRRPLDAANQRSPLQPAGPADEPIASRSESELRHELNLAFTDLGAATFVLAHHGALNEPRLAPRVRQIRELFAQLDVLERTTPISASDHSAPAEHAAAA
jgi:hypothetical protein